MGQVDTVYANAIFELAKEENKVEEMNNEFKDLYQVFKTQDDLRKILETPVISSQEKKDLLDKLFKDEVSKNVFNFMKVLVDKDRMNEFMRISEGFFELYRKEANILLAEVYTVDELPEDIIASLTEKLAELTGSQIEIKQIVDDTLLGGVKIKIGSKIIDSSIIHKLNDLGESLREVSL